MPKGQYTRKPRQPVEAEMQHLADTAPERSTASLNRAMDEQPNLREALQRHAPPISPEQARRFSAEDLEKVTNGDVPREMMRDLREMVERPAPLQAPPAEPDHETFDDWMDEPAPIMPSDDMVSRKVRTWAGAVCGISHEVMWSPQDDSRSIEVVLTTVHGTARMKKPAGQWSEADVAAALDEMRGDLRV